MDNNIQNEHLSVRDHVLQYLGRGWSPIPVEARSKKPTLKGWSQGGLINIDNINSHFSDQNNVGIVLGDASAGLVDIDIDAVDGLKLASEFLPPTGMIFGRQSSRRSHWVYRVPQPARLYETSDDQGEKLIEVRGTGHFTVFPPSVHESGESIFYEGDGEPGSTTWDELVQCALCISFSTILSREWKAGSRHQLTLAFAGYMASRGWLEHEVNKIVEVVTRHANDGEAADRFTAVSTTFARYRANESVVGRRELENVLGAKTVAVMERWLSRSHRKSPVTIERPDLAALHDAIRSDIDLTRHIATNLRDDLVYCPTREQWYRRQGHVYLPAAEAVVEQTLITELTGIADQVAPASSVGNLRRQMLSAARIASVARVLRSDGRLHRHSSHFDCSSLVGCPDGSILDLDTRSFASNANQIVTKQLGALLNNSADAKLWREFLRRTFRDDKQLISFIQRAVGYTLTGRGSERCLFVLIGNGANGKSTFLNVIRRLFGDYGGSTPSHTLMASRFGQTNTDDLAALVGKRFVQAQEAEAGDRLAEAKIKMMTGNDPITCRALYDNYFTYDPQFVLWLATNEMPNIGGGSDAVWERLRIIPFDVTIPVEQRDLGLQDKLIGELPGILNWAIEGYHEWKQQGLNPPDKVQQTRSLHRAEKDYVSQWIAQECTVADTAHSSSRELYRAFSGWANANRVDALDSIKFSRELERLGYRKIKRSEGMKWLGLCLSTAEEFQGGIIGTKAA